MSDIRFRATRRAGTSTCRVMEYDDGQTWIAAEAEGSWWRTPLTLTQLERVLATAPPGERVVDVMRRIVPHYNQHLDVSGKHQSLAGGFLRAVPRVQTQRGWAAPRVKTG